jgi:hypothetical protein
MSDVFILYAVVCYLFYIGGLFESWGSLDATSKIINLIFLFVAPVALPIFIGMNYVD